LPWRSAPAAGILPGMAPFWPRSLAGRVALAAYLVAILAALVALLWISGGDSDGDVLRWWYGQE